MSVVNTEFTFNDKPISYEVVENGYNIYLDGNIWISQLEPYIPHKDVSYEECALMQIQEIIAIPEEDLEEIPGEEDETSIENRVSDLESASTLQEEEITQCQEALVELYEALIGGEV